MNQQLSTSFVEQRRRRRKFDMSTLLIVLVSIVILLLRNDSNDVSSIVSVVSVVTAFSTAPTISTNKAYISTRTLTRRPYGKININIGLPVLFTVEASNTRLEKQQMNADDGADKVQSKSIGTIQITIKQMLLVSILVLFRIQKQKQQQLQLHLIRFRTIFEQQCKVIKLKTKRLAVSACLIMAMTTSSMLFPAGSSPVWWLSVSPSHASTATTIVSKQQQQQQSSSSLIQKWFNKYSSPSIDEIVTDYVTKYMFDDDTASYDPFESSYREAYTDTITGKNTNHASAIREIAQSILSPQSVGSTSTTSTSAAASGTTTISKLQQSVRTMFTNFDAGVALTTIVRLLQSRIGLSETAAVGIIAASFVVGVPISFLFIGMIIGGISKRNMNNLMKQRYGDTYTVDATMKQEEIITAPDDDDEDDDDEDDNDDDDDDDDDDDSEDNKGKK